MKKNSYIFLGWIDDPKNALTVQKLTKIFNENDLHENQTDPQFAFVLGGDGTFLKAFHKYHQIGLKLIGINSGTLGFYTFANAKELTNNPNKLSVIFDDKNFIHPYVIKMTLYDENKRMINEYFALNDIVVQTIFTLKAKIMVNEVNNVFLNYEGSGIILSTPSGSTAINMSNDSVLYFSYIAALCLSFILPINNHKYHNLRNNLLFDDKQTLYLQVSNNVSYQIAFDGVLVPTEELSKTKVFKFTLQPSNCFIFLPTDPKSCKERIDKFISQK